MKLFINDKYIRVLSTERYDPATHRGPVDHVLTPDVPLSSVKLTGRVLVTGGTRAYMDALLTLMQVRRLRRLDTIFFVTDDYEGVKSYVKDQFRIVKAAGGLVLKGDQLLMIYRLGRWDLPKGKLDKGERTLAAAEREVAEECGIRAVVQEKITSTWHAYIEGGRSVLKKTTWYLMTCVDDTAMAPQREEGIEQLRWMSRQEANEALEMSYRTIQQVFADWDKLETERMAPSQRS